MKTIMTLVSFLVGLVAVVSSGPQDPSTPPSALNALATCFSASRTDQRLATISVALRIC
jgi:hypothetical protein